MMTAGDTGNAPGTPGRPPGDEERMDELRESLIARLKRIEGQARGIQRMTEEKRSCDEIIGQLAAMKAAIDQVAINILGHHLAECIEKHLAQGREVQDAIAEFMPVFRKLS